MLLCHKLSSEWRRHLWHHPDGARSACASIYPSIRMRHRSSAHLRVAPCRFGPCSAPAPPLGLGCCGTADVVFFSSRCLSSRCGVSRPRSAAEQRRISTAQLGVIVAEEPAVSRVEDQDHDAGDGGQHLRLPLQKDLQKVHQIGRSLKHEEKMTEV